MKVLFLDIDGVLNSYNTLHEDESLETDLILRLKSIIDQTDAKIVLSSSWRIITSAIRKIMDTFINYDLYLAGLTPNGIPADYVRAKGYEPTRRYLAEHEYSTDQDRYIDATHDRGAEIMYWLDHHENIESFVILDDEESDIIVYYPDNIVKTSYQTGLSDEDVKKAVSILNKAQLN